ncbi:MAG: F0F1 ATP synthase subunit gamma [Rickettsiales bacterium]
MPSLKSLKNRIKSVKSTQKITKAMKMVAASKLKKAREQADNATPYANKMAAIVRSLAAGTDETSPELKLLHGNGNTATHLIIVVSSDRGLCGAFNSTIVRYTKRKIEELQAKGKKYKLLFVGKKAYDVLRSHYSDNIVGHYNGLGRRGLKFNELSGVIEQVFKMFAEDEFDVCSVIFNKFKNAISHEVTDKQLIPLDLPANENHGSMHYDYEPDEDEILHKLLPKNIAVQIFYAVIESIASEQGARMTAMDNATRNSGEMIKKLQLVYNRTRQAYITKELIEIISGAQAV